MFRFRNVFLGYSLALAVTVSACGVGYEAEVSSVAAGRTRTLEVWNRYVGQVGAESPRLQPGCEPTRMEYRGDSYRGTVVLLHGFSPCPQQYFEIASHITAAGYDVFLPLNPGHGRPFFSDNRDDVSKLPDMADVERYVTFGDQMVSLLAQAPGVRVLGGLSLGGALAALAAERAPANVLDRLVLLSPYFGNANDGLRTTLSLARNAFKNPLTRGIARAAFAKEVGWGEGCRSERNRGRTGYCDFNMGHLLATEEVGHRAFYDMDKVHAKSVQFVRLVGDVSASPTMMEKSLDVLRKRGIPVSDAAYGMDAQVNHSLLSRWDSPDENKYWIDPLNAKLSAYITEGKGFNLP